MYITTYNVKPRSMTVECMESTTKVDHVAVSMLILNCN